MTTIRSPFGPCCRAGFSLLEVLVASGILVVALASIAALLPAAGSRLAEATAQDRAAATAAAAMVEIRCRNLAASDMFPTGLSQLPAIVCGETLSLAVTGSVTSAGYLLASSSISAIGTFTPGFGVFSGTLSSGGVPILCAANSGTISARIQNNTDASDRRGFFLEDEVQYAPPSTGNMPMNLFTTIDGTTNGSRQFTRGVCWSAMITPLPWPNTSGTLTAARLSVVTFRKPGGQATAMTLTSNTTGIAAAAGIFQLSGPNTPASLQRTILKPCSRVLAIPSKAASATNPPQWLEIRSSWISGTNPLSTTSSATTCVVFANKDLVTPFVSGSTLNVIGFQNLLFVNEQIVPVQ